jgi:hypothetical protein
VLTVQQMREVVAKCDVPDFEFRVHEEMRYKRLEGSTGGAMVEAPIYYLQGHYYDDDVASGLQEPQHTRKWLLSQHMTDSEIVQTAFKCFLTSMEHRAREYFRYRGKRIFGPHFDSDALYDICKDKYLDYRRTTPMQVAVGEQR